MNTMTYKGYLGSLPSPVPSSMKKNSFHWSALWYNALLSAGT